MLQFRTGDTSATIVLTLTEKVTLDEPYYHFLFTHETTKDVVTITKAYADDTSDHKRRYNEFTLNPSVLFEDQPRGQWHYEVYERQTEGGANVTLLECGKLNLLPATDYAPVQYNSTTSYKVYNG